MKSSCPPLIMGALEVKFYMAFFPLHVLVFGIVKILIPSQSTLFYWILEVTFMIANLI